MIPLKIQLKNFLSYGPQLQTIDFAPYPLICLSGKNGHGKSALLDAITWAIWGQARKTSNTSKPDAGLLHLGQTSMQVILDFQCNGQMYRVKREYFKTYGKPLAQLEFGVFEQGQTNLIPLTDKTIRKTQEKIVQTIHLDYDAFVNTAFLRQGHSNEFSQKSPKDRKTILGTILGLDQYEKIRKLAMEKVREAVNKKNTLTAIHEKMLEQLTKKDQLAQSKKELKEQETELFTRQKEITKKTAALEEEEKILRHKRQQSEMLAFRLEQQKKELRNTLEQIQEARATWRTIHHKKLSAHKYPQLLEKKTELTAKLTLHHKQLEAYLQLKNEYLQEKDTLQTLEARHAKKVAAEQSDINITIKNFEIEQQHIAQQIQKLHELDKAQTRQLEENKKQLAKNHTESELLQKNIQKLPALEKQFEKRKETYQRWIANGQYLHTQLEQLQQKKELVTNEDAPCCPLCEQNLSASRKRFLQQKFSDTGRMLFHRCKRLQKVTTALKGILVAQHKQLEKHKQDKQKSKELNFHAKQLQEKKQELQKSIEQNKKENLLLEKKQKEIQGSLRTKKQELEKKLQDGLKQNKDYMQALQKVKTYETRLQKTAIDKTVIENIKQALAQVEKEITALQSAQEHINQQADRKKNIQNLCSTAKGLKQEVSKKVKELQQYNNLEKKEREYRDKKQQLAQETKQFTQKKEQILQEKANLNAQEDYLKAREKEQQQLQKDLKQLETVAENYQIIAGATSKDGVQALLIEDAIPEIENEANEILAKLTDGQAHVIIESLRDLKKGGTRETLDIHISDTSGIRPYELFSGGEAFRIDFALRIAISKLLARRAGTALQTLIIDEGFGSQDEQGLNQIMDAIYRIQDDFSKVIIVSHLSAMKDQFPIHFSVYKNAQGSHVSVIEQG